MIVRELELLIEKSKNIENKEFYIANNSISMFEVAQASLNVNRNVTRGV